MTGLSLLSPSEISSPLHDDALSITSKTNVNYTIEIYTDLKDKTKPTRGTKQETATTTGQTTYALSLIHIYNQSSWGCGIFYFINELAEPVQPSGY